MIQLLEHREKHFVVACFLWGGVYVFNVWCFVNV